MEEFLKRHFKHDKTVVFDNEDQHVDMHCRYLKNGINSWTNGYKIEFNGALYTYKTFKAFYRKFNQLKTEYSLQLKSW